MPEGLDLARAAVQPLEAAPQVKLEEEGWTSPSTRAGGWAGMGMGFGVGGLACVAAGPLAPLCFATVVPLATTVGAVGGAAVGKAVGSSAEGVADKSALLRREWSSLAARSPLTQAVERQLPGRPLAATPAAATGAAPATAAEAPWRLRVGYATLGTLGSGSGKPFALQGTALLEVWRAGQPAREVAKVYGATSTARLTLEEWRADDAAALRRALDEVGAALASQVAADLAASVPARR